MSVGTIMQELGVSRRTAEAVMESLDKVHVPGVRKAFVRRGDVAGLLEANTVKADPRKRAAA